LPSGLSGIREIHVPADYPEIQQAIDAASPFDVIVVSPGSYHEEIRYYGKPLKVVSLAGPRFTHIFATSYPVSCVSFLDGEGAGSQLVGFGIHGGRSFYGGGIRCEGSAPYIANCIISGNSGEGFGTVGYGCGVYGSPILYRCLIQGNGGTCTGINGYAVGGGVFGSPHMIECVVWGNFAGIGGGAVLEANAVVEDCIFLENEVGPCSNQYGPADAYGGAGTAQAGVVLTRCKFVQNIAFGVTDADGVCYAYEPGMWGGIQIDCVSRDNKVRCFE